MSSYLFMMGITSSTCGLPAFTACQVKKQDLILDLDAVQRPQNGTKTVSVNITAISFYAIATFISVCNVDNISTKSKVTVSSSSFM